MASREPRNSLTLFGKVDAVLGIFSMVSAVVYSIISGAFRALFVVNLAQIPFITTLYKEWLRRYLFESSDQIYLKYCQSSQVEPNFLSTDQGVKGFWIGSPRATFVGVFFHRGGFAMDGTKLHIDLCLELQRSLDQNGIELAWVYSTYTLTPHATCPTQFCEAVGTLNYILHDLRRHPSEVILAGDSAGANLNTTRPAFIPGAVTEDLCFALGIYATVQKYLNQPLAYPEGFTSWTNVQNLSSAATNCYLAEWAVLTGAAENQSFNAIDGAPFTWESFRPQLADRFRLPWTRPDLSESASAQDHDVPFASYDPPPRGYGPPSKAHAKFTLTEWAKRPEVAEAWGKIANDLRDKELRDPDRIFGFIDVLLLIPYPAVYT